MKRHYLTVLASGALVAAALTPGYCAKKTLTVTKASATPQKVGGNGATVDVVATVTYPGSTITKVEAQAASGGSAGPVSALTNTKGSVYRGTVRVPVNPSRSTLKGSVSLLVTINNASGAQHVKIATLKVGPWNDSAPPPPPPAK